MLHLLSQSELDQSHEGEQCVIGESGYDIWTDFTDLTEEGEDLLTECGELRGRENSSKEESLAEGSSI